MIGALRSGAHGIQLQVPTDLRILKNHEHFAELAGPDGVIYHLFYFPGLHMAFRRDLQPALERHARLLFDEAFVNNGGDGPKRTDDASWSPLVEVEPLTVGGAPALRTVHRMIYQPGREMMMGHLLIPIAGGLFETRVIAMDQQTGFREVALMMTRKGEAFLAQKEYDDPAHDAKFPQHSLSRVRASLRAIAGPWQPQVLQAAAPIPDGEIVLSRLGCALVPPPGFVLQHEGEQAQLARTSFCGTDGRETFLIERRDSVKLARLRSTAEKEARAIHEQAGVTNLQLHVAEVGERVLVIVEGNGNQGRLRNALLWFLDGNSRLWSLAQISSVAIPVPVLAAELDAAARSFRLTA